MAVLIATNGRKSNGAKALADTGNFKRFWGKRPLTPKDVVVNWGVSIDYTPPGVRVLNNPYNVKIATNKFTTFTVLADAGVSIVPWTSNKELAEEWLKAGNSVVVRAILNGHSGEGITVETDSGATLPTAPLYTRYVKKDREYRVHATTAGVFLTQRKIRDPAREPTNWQIRSHDNGFIFAVNNVEASAARDQLAVATLKALGLDFGAVDIIEKNDVFYVLEVNSAPGLEGNTINLYAEALSGIANSTTATN